MGPLGRGAFCFLLYSSAITSGLHAELDTILKSTYHLASPSLPKGSFG